MQKLIYFRCFPQKPLHTVSLCYGCRKCDLCSFLLSVFLVYHLTKEKKILMGARLIKSQFNFYSENTLKFLSFVNNNDINDQPSFSNPPPGELI